jgi:hypothetical protein
MKTFPLQLYPLTGYESFAARRLAHRCTCCCISCQPTNTSWGPLAALCLRSFRSSVMNEKTIYCCGSSAELASPPRDATCDSRQQDHFHRAPCCVITVLIPRVVFRVMTYVSVTSLRLTEVIFSMAQQPPAGQGLLVVEA